jgi:hypothetical protein
MKNLLPISTCGGKSACNGASLKNVVYCNVHSFFRTPSLRALLTAARYASSFVILFLSLLPAIAWAQQAVVPAPAPAAIAAPAAAVPAPANPAAVVPPAPANRPAPQASPLSNVFPTLPPSTPCKPGDLWGFYRLEKLYEQPAGKESADFQATPMQYIHFSADSTYRPLKLATKTNNRRAFYDKFKRKEGDSLTQYTVYEGFVYFYNEGKIVDTQACFIVANDFGEFKKGRMLLMPPAPQEGQEVTTRLLRVYHNFNLPRGRPPHAGARKP